MDDSTEREGLKHLEHIEAELSEIKNRTPDSWRSFINGIMQGAGAIVGSIAALALLGWVLSIFGVVPGFGTIAQYLQDIQANLRR